MCATAWAKPTPASPFAETAQAATDQYTNPSNQSGNQNQTTCSVVVENGQLVRVCRTIDRNGNVVKTTRQVLGPAGTSTALATARPGLPFTGLDLTVLVLLGGSLVTTGVVIRTASRKRRRRPAA